MDTKLFLEATTYEDAARPDFRVGGIWTNMDEFRMSFNTYTMNRNFDAKTLRKSS